MTKSLRSKRPARTLHASCAEMWKSQNVPATAATKRKLVESTCHQLVQAESVANRLVARINSCPLSILRLSGAHPTPPSGGSPVADRSLLGSAQAQSMIMERLRPLP